MNVTNGCSLLRRAFNGLRSVTTQNKSYRIRKEKMRQFYRRKMTEKLFQFWKNYNLRKRIERRIEGQFNIILESIKFATLTAVEDLKRKISIKDSELTNIRASKSDFAYQFTQSILKVINS